MGPLAALAIVRDQADPNRNRGYGFCQYKNAADTEKALEGLNGLQVGDRALIVKRAHTSQEKIQLGIGLGGVNSAAGFSVNPLNAAAQAAALGVAAGSAAQVEASAAQAAASVGAGAGFPGSGAVGGSLAPDGGQPAPALVAAAAAAGFGDPTTAGAALAAVTGAAGAVPAVPAAPAAPPADATRVLVLRNMCSREELTNDSDYAEIKEDVKDECGRFGAVLACEMPKPSAEGAAADPPGVGAIYVEYGDAAHAVAAAAALGGRDFGGKKVEAGFLTEEKWAAKDFSS